MSSAYQSPRVGGDTVERTWTCITANDETGAVIEAQVGRRTVERVAAFAFRADAEAWLERQSEEGFSPAGLGPLAIGYHGPTDSTSNCWSARATREISS